MPLERSIFQWSNCSPSAMAQQSESAINHAFEDARADILTLAKLLCEAGYPRRGSAEERQTIEDFASKVQALISHKDAVELF